MFRQKNCRRHDAWAGALLWWSCQSPAAHSCGLLNHPNSFLIIQTEHSEECSSLMQIFLQIHCSTCPVILSVTATQYACSLNGIYHPHWLVQWSRHCSHLCIPVHSPWLPVYSKVDPNCSHYINNGRFSGQICVCVCVCIEREVTTNVKCKNS